MCTLLKYIERHRKQQCVKIALFHASSPLKPIALQIKKPKSDKLKKTMLL